jgi:endonuclease-8
MDGTWHLYRHGDRWRGGPEWEVRLLLANDTWQAVGYRLPVVELLPRDHEGDAVGHLGPDLLGPDWDPEEAVRRLAADPDREIGPALLDQRNLAGVGNLYRAEVCFLLGVSGCSRATRSARPRSPPATRAGARRTGCTAGPASPAAGVGRRSGPPSRATRPTSGCRTGARAASPADGRSRPPDEVDP